MSGTGKLSVFGICILTIMDCGLKGIGNHKSQIPNNKWFGKLTTLSQVEGQITMTKIQNFKIDEFVNSQIINSLSFWRKPESSDLSTFWMPDQVRHDENGPFMRPSNLFWLLNIAI
jgi:hypothetical protein